MHGELIKMYKMNNGIRVMKYEELRPSVSSTLVQAFLDNYSSGLEQRLLTQQKLNKVPSL